MKIHMRENWYRDVWIFLVTILVLFSIMSQSNDRNRFEHSMVDARYGDCISGNLTREALRKQVEQSRLQRPLLLKLLPQFNNHKILKIIEKNEKDELRGLSNRECIEYAEEALAGRHKRYEFSSHKY